VPITLVILATQPVVQMKLELPSENMIKVFLGRQGCGMGICTVLDKYAVDRKYILSVFNTLDKKCQECVKLNEDDRKNKSNIKRRKRK